jgi:putative transposase
MPARNIVKTYVAGGYYHIYNRGIEKRIIFMDEMDYKTFLKYLKEALSPPPDPKNMRVTVNLKGGTFKGLPKPVKNFKDSINLIAYCLMPNHFHLLVEQTEIMDMKKFMQSIITRYSMYFNKKYNRVGKLFQGHYKAVLVSDENYLLHLSRYIHLNPYEYTKHLKDAYSSYPEYLGRRKTLWIKPQVILSFFKNANKDFMKGINTYQDFVEKYKGDSGIILGKITLEN